MDEWLFEEAKEMGTKIEENNGMKMSLFWTTLESGQRLKIRQI